MLLYIEIIFLLNTPFKKCFLLLDKKIVTRMLSFFYTIILNFDLNDLDTFFLHSVALYFCFNKGFHINVVYIFLSKIVHFVFVGNELFRLIEKLVDRLIEIKIVVCGSPNA